MRRGLTVAGLLTIIVVSFGYATIRYQANSEREDTWFNTHWRSGFAEHATLRWLFGLHRAGDRRAGYLHVPADEALTFVVVQDPSITVPTSALASAAERLAELLGLPGGVAVANGGMLTASPAYTTAQLRRLPRPSASSPGPVLYVYVLTSSVDAPSNLGSTIRDNGIALFMAELASLANRNPATLEPLIISTVLHEAGHQLGLAHMDDAACIMAPSVEQPAAEPLAGANIPVDFCPSERAQIAGLLQAR